MKPITERDLEQQYHQDTGMSAYRSTEVTSTYTRGFYDWCKDQLLILKNKEIEQDDTRDFFLEEN